MPRSNFRIRIQFNLTLKFTTSGWEEGRSTRIKLDCSSRVYYVMHEYAVVILLKLLEWHKQFLTMGMSGVLMKDFLATVVQQIKR